MVLKELADHLRVEVAAYTDLASLLQAETRALVERDFKALYDTVEAKERLIARVDALNGKRAALMGQVATALSVSTEVNLSAVISRLNGPVRAEISRLQETILALIESVKEINSLNALVAKGSIENISKTLVFLGGFLPGTTYKRGGAIEGATLKGQRLSEGA